jgi:DNA-binding LytR/AlgR family response regulator
MRVLVIDDQPSARSALANILSERSDVDSFELANDAGEALEKLGRNSYDLLLLDINMPELSGIGFVDQLKQSERPLPSIMFLTARNRDAVAGFDGLAADSVGENFSSRFSSQRIDGMLEIACRKSSDVAPQNGNGHAQRVARPAPRIAIKAKGRIVFIDPGIVIAVQAEGNYVLLQREGGSYLLRESISEMAEKLEPYGFIRIHRSVLVNASFVEEIQPCQTGEYELRVKGGKQYTVTRTYKKNLRSLAEFWIGTGAFLTD